MSYYGTPVAALTYHADRGNTAWITAGTDERAAALLRASEYIDGTYRASFQGYKTGGRAQAREWPRTDAYVFELATWQALDANTVPDEIERATYEAALRELTPGYLTPDFIPSEGKKSVSVDGAVSVEYWSPEKQPSIKKIQLILLPLLASDGYSTSSLSGKVDIA